MSHADERKEKDCLNCGSIVQGRYCQVCGQENIVPHETFGHMIKHFFYDITHFDSKFLDSVKYLVSRPGFLSKQYMLGRRTTYLNPVKMYVFTSAIFFLILFSFYGTNMIKMGEGRDKSKPTRKEYMKVERYMQSKAATKKDSTGVTATFDLIRKEYPGIDSIDRTKGLFISYDGGSTRFKSVREYDSVQKALPKADRDVWLKKLATRKSIDLNSRFEEDDPRLIKDIYSKFLHSFPYILFVSLPLFALFLKLLYIRNKKFYFVDHGIFLIHLYIFTFILMLVYMGFTAIKNAAGWNLMDWLNAALVFYGIWYAFRAMKNFYGQRTGKTLLKFIVFNMLCSVSILVLFGLFLIITILRA